ncbi:MAG: Holliday junction resolvase RuvX [Patescibacteria group bacterium]|jgi:putative Holliday junction resolvase
MKLVGIDYGSSKVGLALGESDIKMALPHKVVAPQELFLEIERLVEREGLDLAVMGLPMGMNGLETEQTQTVKKFAAELAEKITIPLVFEDERLSTAQAKRDGHDDAVAAMYILQSYLDRTYGSNSAK